MPSSDHHDGARFFNPGQARRRVGLGALLRWRLLERREVWPQALPAEHHPPPPDAVPRDRVAVTFVNHATVLLRLPDAQGGPGTVVLTDPIFSERCSPVSWAGPRRVRPPGLPIEALPRVDLVLLSHDHYDHMDLPSLRHLAERHAPAVVTTLGNARRLRAAGFGEVTELDWWGEAMVRGLRVTATPARHFSGRTPFDRNNTLWGGFMLRRPDGGGRLLFAGDSGAGPHWAAIRERLGVPDVALLPVGAYEPRWFMAPVHMNPAEAVSAHGALGARHSVGTHFGTFRLTDEAIDAPAQALAAAREAAGLGEAAFRMLGFGETAVLPFGDG